MKYFDRISSTHCNSYEHNCIIYLVPNVHVCHTEKTVKKQVNCNQLARGCAKDLKIFYKNKQASWKRELEEECPKKLLNWEKNTFGYVLIFSADCHFCFLSHVPSNSPTTPALDRCTEKYMHAANAIICCWGSFFEPQPRKSHYFGFHIFCVHMNIFTNEIQKCTLLSKINSLVGRYLLY